VFCAQISSRQEEGIEIFDISYLKRTSPWPFYSVMQGRGRWAASELPLSGCALITWISMGVLSRQFL